MKKYFNKILTVGLVLTTMQLASCSGDYLDTEPTASVGSNTTFATTENAAMAVNGIAQIMCTQQYSFSQGYAGENRIKSIYGEYPSKEFIYNQYAVGWADIMNGNYYTQSSANYTVYPWYYYYTIIGNANSIIAHVDAAVGSDAEKQFIKAQALTFRAYAYSQLIQLYSYRWADTNGGATNGVILRLDETTGDMPLSTVKECYDQIYSDCESAIGLYKQSGKDRDAAKVWLPNLNVAYAVYARAGLNRQDYQTALTYAKLARENYPLMTNSDYAAGFCKPTSEWIFGSYADGTENQWYWTFGTQFACNGYYASKTRYGAGAGKPSVRRAGIAIDRPLIARHHLVCSRRPGPLRQRGTAPSLTRAPQSRGRRKHPPTGQPAPAGHQGQTVAGGPAADRVPLQQNLFHPRTQFGRPGRPGALRRLRVPRFR